MTSAEVIQHPGVARGFDLLAEMTQELAVARRALAMIATGRIAGAQDIAVDALTKMDALHGSMGRRSSNQPVRERDMV